MPRREADVHVRFEDVFVSGVCVTPASLRRIVNVCADALRVASEESTEGEPAASRTGCDRVRVCRGDTCRQDTSEPAEPKGSRDSLIPFFLFWELCVSGVEASSIKIELFKCSDCRVIRVFLFFLALLLFACE